MSLSDLYMKCYFVCSSHEKRVNVSNVDNGLGKKMSKDAVEKGLCNVFFSGAKFYIDGKKVDSEWLSQRESLLPIVLVAIDFLINDPIALNTMLRYKIHFDDQALCFISASEIEILDKNRLFARVEQLGGFERIKRLWSVRTPDGGLPSYELLPFCELIQDALRGKSSVGELSASTHLAFLQSMITFDLFSEAPASLGHDEGDADFNMESFYHSLDSDSKSFIEEIAVVAVTQYFSLHRNENMDNVTARTSFVVDETCLLAVSLSHAPMLHLLAKQFHCKSYQLVFSEEIYALRDSMFRFSEPRNFGTPSTTWFQEAKKQYAKLQFSPNGIKLLSNARVAGRLSLEVLVQQLMDWPSDMLQKLRDLNPPRNDLVFRAHISQKIRTSLNDKVIGQESAVDSLCKGYLSSSIEYQQGPRAIFTFVGPSGVGKTYLAQQLLEEIEQYERTGYEFNLFNMENYADQRDGMRLFGSGSQYTDSALGVLTHRVRAKPRQILLFDEIEKAHSTVIQSLLSVLDSARAKDQTSQEDVDFSQCIIIFTTNLGQEIISNNIQHRTLSVIDILRNAINPSNDVSLSPEFINRLSKGYPIIFKPLKVNHLVKLTELELLNHARRDESISFKWHPKFASFVLKTLSPDINVRALKSQTIKLQSDILTRSTRYFDDVIHQSVTFSIEEHLSDSRHSSKLLVLDDDRRVFEALGNVTDDVIRLCQHVDCLAEALDEQLPDALLIDLTMIESLGLSLSDFTAQYIKSKSMPLFTYRLVDSEATGLVYSTSHEVREHFEIGLYAQHPDDTSVDKEMQLSEMLERIQYYLFVEHTLSRMIKRKEAIDYSFDVQPNAQGFLVTFKQNATQQVIDGNDLTTSEYFKMTLPNVVLKDVIGLERAKKRIVDVLGWIKSPEKLSHLGVSVPSGFLFSGPTGTGKTLLAKAVAGESGLPFFAVSAAQLSSAYSGGTIENIKKLFSTARKYAPAIVFIDEIDAIAAKRSDNPLERSWERNGAVNALLTEMDGFTSSNDGVFVMAATNHPDMLDEAIVRPGRFDEIIQCDLPNSIARKRFFERFMTHHRLSSSKFNLVKLVSASRGMSSAEIEQVCREVVYESISKNLPITDELIRETIIRVSYGSPSENIVLSDAEKLRTSYHEAGHLLASVLLFPELDIDFVTIEPRNYTLGFVATRPLYQYEGYSRATINKRLEVLLAGRTAERIFSGSDEHVSTGASNDISKATQLAMHAVYEAGLEPSIGPIDVSMLTKFEESDLLLQAQQSVQTWLSEAEERVLKLLTVHRDELEDIAQHLHEKESLMNSEIEDLILKLQLRKPESL